ncbi:TPA: menaquinone biosynthesis decarboxylase, partial [bacterium]|nr:menaquinone biosynthesis decarboxylase [bacterium]
MMFKDIRDFIAHLEEKGLLLRIKEGVGPELEVACIVNRVVKACGKALFFENPIGFQYPIATNLFGSDERVSIAIGDILDIQKRISMFIKPSIPKTMIDKVKFIPKLYEISKFIPKKISNAPSQEIVVEEPDLSKFPHLKLWPKDGGKFITLPLVFTKDPDTGMQNCGIYRMQVFDKKTTGMHWHPNKDGARHYRKYKERKEKMPVAVSLGGPPSVIFSACSPLPPDFDEMIFAGFLQKSPVEMTRCKTIEIDVPAYSEIVFEGYVDTEELRDEGPFGDHTGYYSEIHPFPVFHLTCITHRKNPIYPATVVGKPPMEDCFIARAISEIFLPVIKMLIPEIVDINLPFEGVFHNLAIVSIKKEYPGVVRKVASSLWGLGQMANTKVFVIVDSDVSLENLSEVVWKVLSNIDPRRDIFFVDGPVDILDHASPYFGYGSKVAIDGTRKTREDGIQRSIPEEAIQDPKIEVLVEKKDYQGLSQV